MKTSRVLTIILATAGLLALAAPAEAQRRGGMGGRPGGPSMGGRPGNFHPGNFHRGHFHGGNRVFVGFGFPYWGGFWGPYWGYPWGYWGYPYGYYYPPPAPYYGGYQQGVYQGRMANPPNRTNESGKDTSMAARVQRQLAIQGYYHGDIDGVVGTGTRNAIRRYQRANGLAVDGEIGGELLQSMGLG